MHRLKMAPSRFDGRSRLVVRYQNKASRGEKRTPVARKNSYEFRSQRLNATWNGMVAPFVMSRDVIPFQLLYSLQRKKPWKEFGGYILSDLILSDEIMVWTSDQDAIVCLVGQNIATNRAHLIDDLNVAGVAGNQACQLRLTRVGAEVLSKLKDYKVVLCGYSLGGTATGCLSTTANVERSIIFNGGAPPSNAARPTPKNCQVYHIVGDLLSTHFIECKRIYLQETFARRNQTDEQLQTDGIKWYDIGYYHDLDRFMDMGSPWEFVDAQFEQNSLENYFFYKPSEALDIAGAAAGLISTEFNFRKKVQQLICRNPIPGSYATTTCSELEPKLLDKIAGGIIGGGLGGLAAGLSTGGAASVPGAIAGASAGAALASGEKGLLDVVNPDIVKSVVGLGEKLAQGTSVLDRLNKQSGTFTGKIADDKTPNVFGSTGLVVRPK